MNKSRANNHTLQQELDDLHQKYQKIQKEVNLMSSPAARAVANRDNRDVSNNSDKDLDRDMKRELSQALKQVYT